MSIIGTVRNGRIEVEGGVQLPDGTRVCIDVTPDDWIKEWDQLAQEISEASRGKPSAVDLLSEMRR